MRAFSSALLLVLCLAAPAWGTTPALPQTYIDTMMPSTAGYITKTVCASGCDFTSLDTAVHDASVQSAGTAGVILTLTAGQTFTESVTLPLHNNTGWVIIQSSAVASLPAGVRVGPAQAGLMAKIVSPDTSSIIAMAASSAAHHYRLIGLELTTTTSVGGVFTLVLLGNDETTIATMPHDIIVDRCYVHGHDSPVQDSLVGVSLQGITQAVIDSYVSEIHSRGFDSQAVSGTNGPGPYKIVNNYLSAAGEVIMFGGSDPYDKTENVIPSDIEIRRNYLFKPLTWFPSDPSFVLLTADVDGHTSWSVKDLFELKNAKRVLVEGNVMENNWKHSQTGAAILLTPRNQGGSAPWSTVEDVTFQHNIVKHSAWGVSVLGTDDLQSSQSADRLLIYNNLFLDIDNTVWAPVGQPAPNQVIQLTDGPRNLAFDHNTMIRVVNAGTGWWLWLGENATKLDTNFVFTNNISACDVLGIVGGSQNPGTDSIAAYTTNPTVTANVLWNTSGGCSGPGSYPAGNFFPADVSNVGFTDYAGGNYQLTSGSAYHNAATDGTDIGVNVAALNAALGLTSSMLQGTVTLGGTAKAQ